MDSSATGRITTHFCLTGPLVGSFSLCSIICLNESKQKIQWYVVVPWNLSTGTPCNARTSTTLCKVPMQCDHVLIHPWNEDTFPIRTLFTGPKASTLEVPLYLLFNERFLPLLLFVEPPLVSSATGIHTQSIDSYTTAFIATSATKHFLLHLTLVEPLLSRHLCPHYVYAY